MKFVVEAIIALSLITVSVSEAASTDSIRKASTVVAFRKVNACPATGKTQRTCKGYIVDHIVPLCAGGPDAVTNMQWQTTADSYKKDAQERALCRRLKAAK